MAEPAIIRAVLRGLGDVGVPAGARVLDVSCGDGNLIAALLARGYAAEGTHFRRDDYIFRHPSPALQKATIHDGVDLNRPLPFPDAAYDAVTATEVIEHLSAHPPFIAEIGRILKPGGITVLTTPNIHRMSSRLGFLLSGTHRLCGGRPGWDVPAARLYTTHFNPVYFPVLHTLLFQQGMRVIALRRSVCPPEDVLPGALSYPLVAAATVVNLRHAGKRSRAGGRDLLRWMLDFRMLMSKQLVVVARKKA